MARLDACKAGVNADNATHKCLKIARYAYKVYGHWLSDVWHPLREELGDKFWELNKKNNINSFPAWFIVFWNKWKVDKSWNVLLSDTALLSDCVLVIMSIKDGNTKFSNFHNFKALYLRSWWQ